MKNDENIISEWKELDNIEGILAAIRHYELDLQAYLADTVASVCNIEREEMLGNCEKAYIAQARWLYWYAYRYMTAETFEKIAIITVEHNKGAHLFTPNAVGAGCNKMSSLINNEPLWKKRWMLIKRIIKLRDSNEEPQDTTIVIKVPKGLKEKIKFEIKEK